ncbi:hypothetical protein L9F63_019105, partial [Diploptera punctata]
FTSAILKKKIEVIDIEEEITGNLVEQFKESIGKIYRPIQRPQTGDVDFSRKPLKCSFCKLPSPIVSDYRLFKIIYILNLGLFNIMRFNL